MTDLISWAATAATIIAASMTAANLGSRITGYGFVVFTLGAIGWIAVGALTHQPAILWTNIVLTVLDLFGIWRWLGREAKVEEGGRAAAQASERTPGEALFPVSLLSSAPLLSGSTELGKCVDAMAGAVTGHINYLVVSQGGVVGVGETLRRVPWSAVHVEGDRVACRIGRDQFERLDVLQRDEWPGR